MMSRIPYRRTRYDEILLATGDPVLARERVCDEVESLVEQWAAGPPDSERE